MSFRRFAETATRVLVNGIPGGIAWAPDGRPFAVLALTVQGGRIVADRRPRGPGPARLSWISRSSRADSGARIGRRSRFGCLRGSPV